MDNNVTKRIDKIFKDLDNNLLGPALRSTRSLVNENPHLIYDEELENIENDYRLMLDYMERGFNDPQRGEIYTNLIAKLYRFVSDTRISYRTQHVSFFADTARKASNKQFTNDIIKAELENFVTDVAMLSLDTEPEKSGKSKNIYRRHNEFMQSLFCYIVISRQWNETDSIFFQDLLLSPLIDNNDAQLIVSALTLATMNNMDARKFETLVNVYINAKDEKLRQKALVGWVFSLPSSTKTLPQIKAITENVLKDKSVAIELADLQKQMVFCLNAEQDTDKIKRDIMPDIIKNNNLNITRFGITEKEEDPMADIFDPGASDRAMEKMEESFQKMMNMQKAGSDIYFGGFSQMKRFPFFYNVANWFYPFYLEHPDISTTVENLKGTPLLVNILNDGPFCDSDKYSFTLAISSVIQHLPDNMKELFNSQEAQIQVVSEEERKSQTYIRRMILQDMYRFFKLFQQNSQLVNPFENKHFTFAANALLKNTALKEYAAELCFFMIKHNNKNALEKLLETYGDIEDTKILLAYGIYELNFTKHPEKAIEYLERLTSIDSDNKRALSLLARAYFENGNYGRSAICYERLYKQAPGNAAMTLNYCIAISKAGDYEKAINLLYRLDIEHPDHTPIIRVLAWALMGLGKYEQAEKAYNRVLESNDAETGDSLNAGYCQWFIGNTAKAINLFKKFLATKKSDHRNYGISKELTDDHDFLLSHGISETDIRLMTDIVSERA